jgi:hypothetical protein
MLRSLVQDPQTLVDLFVNFDCDLNHNDVVER